MAWDFIHRSVGGNGQITMTPGYYTETIDLADDADASTSYLPFPIKSDFTILVTWGSDLGADTYVRVEHSVDGSTWYKKGNIEEDNSVDHDDISKDMSIIAAIDDNLIGTSCMMLYDIDTHGKAPYVRLTVSANGADESSNTAAFTLIPHF
jgi:hypothetical protein